MFDKIFKICIIFILGFIAYTFYLYVLNTRYHFVSQGYAFDRHTGKIFKAMPQNNDSNHPLFRSKEELRKFLLEK